MAYKRMFQSSFALGVLSNCRPTGTIVRRTVQGDGFVIEGEDHLKPVIDKFVKDYASDVATVTLAVDMSLVLSQIEGMSERMRELRLWHWRQVLWNRQLAATDHAKRSGMSATYDKTADEHLKFVQYLNDFFEAGDTAEGDAS